MGHQHLLRRRYDGKAGAPFHTRSPASSPPRHCVRRPSFLGTLQLRPSSPSRSDSTTPSPEESATSIRFSSGFSESPAGAGGLSWPPRGVSATRQSRLETAHAGRRVGGAGSAWWRPAALFIGAVNGGFFPDADHHQQFFLANTGVRHEEVALRCTRRPGIFKALSAVVVDARNVRVTGVAGLTGQAGHRLAGTVGSL